VSIKVASSRAARARPIVLLPVPIKPVRMMFDDDMVFPVQLIGLAASEHKKSRRDSQVYIKIAALTAR
jgi:hypothetical protein